MSKSSTLSYLCDTKMLYLFNKTTFRTKIRIEAYGEGSSKGLDKYHLYTWQPAGLAKAIFVLVIVVVIMTSNYFNLVSERKSPLIRLADMFIK